MFGAVGKHPGALWAERGSLCGAGEGAAPTLWVFFMATVTLIHLGCALVWDEVCVDTPHLLLCFVTSPFLQGAEIDVLQGGGWGGQYQAPGASKAGVPRRGLAC